MKPYLALSLLAALSLAACSGNSTADNGAAVQPSTLNEEALSATENLTANDTLDGNALDASTNATGTNTTGGNAF